MGSHVLETHVTADVPLTTEGCAAAGIAEVVGALHAGAGRDQCLGRVKPSRRRARAGRAPGRRRRTRVEWRPGKAAIRSEKRGSSQAAPNFSIFRVVTAGWRRSYSPEPRTYRGESAPPSTGRAPAPPLALGPMRRTVILTPQICAI